MLDAFFYCVGLILVILSRNGQYIDIDLLRKDVLLMMKKLKTFAELVKIEHTLFSLPFAYMGGILAVRGMPELADLLLITLAVVGARSAGMAWNRLTDRYIDARNPRTQDRHLPRNQISVEEVLVWIFVSISLVMLASWMLNPICLALLPIALLIIFSYSYTKRFTWMSHLILGLCLGMAPVGSWIGIRGTISLEVVLVGLAVALWTAGFDIIYATMDVDFDRQEGLYSIPACFGIERALQASVLLHAVAFALFVLVKFVADLGGYYLIALFVVGFLLYLENRIVAPEDLSRVNLAFFRINSLVSITILVFMILEFSF